MRPPGRRARVHARARYRRRSSRVVVAPPLARGRLRGGALDCGPAVGRLLSMPVEERHAAPPRPRGPLRRRRAGRSGHPLCHGRRVARAGSREPGWRTCHRRLRTVCGVLCVGAGGAGVGGLGSGGCAALRESALFGAICSPPRACLSVVCGGVRGGRDDRKRVVTCVMKNTHKSRKTREGWRATASDTLYS
eukprot:4312686-Prymnesium_polylepis.1